MQLYRLQNIKTEMSVETHMVSESVLTFRRFGQLEFGQFAYLSIESNFIYVEIWNSVQEIR